MILLKFLFRIVQKIVGLLGFTLQISKTKNENTTSSSGYDRVYPHATYSPWQTDTDFATAYNLIKDYTLVDIYRCFELWQLVEQTAKLKKGSLIEIGVWRGGSGALIAHKARLCGIKESVYLCDTFTGVVKTSEKDSVYRGGEHADTSKEIVNDIVGKLALDNVEILTGIFPEDTGKFINRKAFRYCHVDVDVYQSAKDIVDWVWHKLVVGGIIVFDDYGFVTCDGITKLVNDQRNMRDRTIIHNLNGHAIIVKTS